jgi:hypothetical protein
MSTDSVTSTTRPGIDPGLTHYREEVIDMIGVA